MARPVLEGLAQRGAIYDEAQLADDYRRTVAYCFIYAVVTAGQIEMANERQRDLVLGIGDRAVQAMEDNDVGCAAADRSRQRRPTVK